MKMFLVCDTHSFTVVVIINAIITTHLEKSMQFYKLQCAAFTKTQIFRMGRPFVKPTYVTLL